MFDGEEFDMAMRLFTWGYDIYAPNISVMYHYYTSPEENKNRNISKFWDYQWGAHTPRAGHVARVVSFSHHAEQANAFRLCSARPVGFDIRPASANTSIRIR